jgi:hypothetical protein
MSPVSGKRFLVRAYDRDLLEVVVEAADRRDAIRQAEAMYFTDASMDADAFAPDTDIKWHAVPIASQARR